jgi:hypothetical protein
MEQTVMDECFPEMPSVYIQNPTSDGWLGSIDYSSDGGDTFAPLPCPSCCSGPGGDGGRGKRFGTEDWFLIDGDANVVHARKMCLNGRLCEVSATIRNQTDLSSALADEFEEACYCEDVGMFLLLLLFELSI